MMFLVYNVYVNMCTCVCMSSHPVTRGANAVRAE